MKFLVATVQFHFFDLALMILKLLFAQICVFQWTLVKWCYNTSQFLGSKMQKSVFEENKGFECSLFLIEVHVISNPSGRLKTLNP